MKEYCALKTPFLLIYEDDDGVITVSWLETEKQLIDVAEEVKGYGCKIIDAMEIASCRPLENLIK